MSRRDFEYSEPAELYGGGSWNGRRAAITYRRFDAAAEAIRYAVEELSGAGQRACVMEVNEDRFNYIEIRKLYDGIGYPLRRQAGQGNDAM